MVSLEKLANQFSRFPGIGTRQARRFVYFLLNSEPSFIRDLLVSIKMLEEDFRQCETCFRFFERGEGETSTVCRVCGDSNVNKKVLMVVEKDIDLENIERSGLYNGRYFVLGGLIPLLGEKRSSAVRSNELLGAIQNQIKNDGLQEVILALSAHPDGENTALQLAKLLQPISKENSLKISTLGRGLSTGTELEYSDVETLKNALRGRRCE